MNEPRTLREAIAVEMMGEADKVLKRVEALPAMVTSVENKLAVTVAALEGAADKYRMLMTSITEQAKAEASEYFDRKQAVTISKTAEELRVAMQEAARMAFRSEASDKAARLGIALGEAAKEFRRSMWSRLMEHAITALIASAFTAGLVYLIVR